MICKMSPHQQQVEPIERQELDDIHETVECGVTWQITVADAGGAT
jgi:hypothetical protein